MPVQGAINVLPFNLYVCRRITLALSIGHIFWGQNYIFLKSVYDCFSSPAMFLSALLATTHCQFHMIYHTVKNITKITYRVR